MKNNIKLYIDNNLTDINSKDLQYVLTKQISDFNDISRRTGSFSYTIKIPKTNTNKKVFKNIDNLDISNRFNKQNNYRASLYVNDVIMITGFFILNEINESNFEGYIVNETSDIFLKFGDKSLQDINLPEIPFEGLQIPFVKDNTVDDSQIYNNPTLEALNQSLCFDFTSYLQAKKEINKGFKTSHIDYTDLYEVNLYSYSNFFLNDLNLYSSNSTSSNLSYTYNILPIYNLSLDDMIPSNKLINVLKQMFKDIGYSLYIENDLLNDLNLLIPYVGSEYPNWNWKHLAKCFYYTLFSDVNNELKKDTDLNGYYLEMRYPIIVSNFTESNVSYENNQGFYYGNASPSAPPLGEGHKVKNLFRLQQFDVQQFTNTTKNIGGFDSGTFDSGFKMTTEDLADVVVHHIPLSRCEYDPLNNFDFYNKAFSKDDSVRGIGNYYIAPVDGEYEFDLQMSHDIKYFNNYCVSGDSVNYSDVTDYYKQYLNTTSKNIDGYNTGSTFEYKHRERYLAGNTVMFYKESLQNDYTTQSNPIADLFNLSLNDLNNNGYNLMTDRTYKRLTNFSDENVVAFYNPMLRDLYMNNVGQTLEEFLENEETLYKNSSTYPLTENDKVKYFGFNNNTDILNYENNILSSSSPYSFETQRARKLVQLWDSSNPADRFTNYPRVRYGINIKTFPKIANGVIKFKFKTTLKRGEKIRLYYVTNNAFKQMVTVNNIGDNYFQELQSWNDKYTDNPVVQKLKVTYITDESKNLKLQNFLPDIKQKDFIQDLLKTNNLYFDIQENNVTIKKRKDFYIDKSVDLTDKIDSSRISLQPVQIFKENRFGFKPNENDDLIDVINKNNPQKIILFDSIYNDNQIKDVTSTVFYSSENREFIIDRLGFNYTNSHGFEKQIMNRKYETISLTNFTENNDIVKPQNEVDFTYNRSPRIVYQNSTKLNLTGSSPTGFWIKLHNNTPFTSFFRMDIGTTISNINFLNNDTRFKKLFNDQFLDLQNSSIVEFYANLNEKDFFELNLNKKIYINNTLYYIQKIDAFDCLQKNLTKIVLLKI